MQKPKPTPPSNTEEQVAEASRSESFLGLQTADLAGLSVEEITGNRVAITMVMHYYKQLVGENSSLRNDMNTLRTYVAGYNAKRTNAGVGAGLQLLATILIGFGVNVLTSSATAGGWCLLAGGVATQIFGLYFSLRESR